MMPPGVKTSVAMGASATTSCPSTIAMPAPLSPTTLLSFPFQGLWKGSQQAQSTPCLQRYGRWAGEREGSAASTSRAKGCGLPPAARAQEADRRRYNLEVLREKMQLMQQEERKLTEMQRHSQELECTMQQMAWAQNGNNPCQLQDVQQMMRRLEELAAKMDEMCTRISDQDLGRGSTGQRETTEDQIRVLIAQQNLDNRRCEELSTKLGMATEVLRRLEGEKRALEEEVDKMTQVMARQNEEIQSRQHIDLEEQLRHAQEKVQLDEQNSGQGLRQWQRKFILANGSGSSTEVQPSEPEESKAARRWKRSAKPATSECTHPVKGNLGKLGGA